MSRKHQDNLRQQLIDAMTPRLGVAMAESVFQCDLWPVLDAAMTNGELLVAAQPIVQKPVHEAITAWMEVVGWTVQRVKAEENVISRRKLLEMFYTLDESCRMALADAKLISQ